VVCELWHYVIRQLQYKGFWTPQCKVNWTATQQCFGSGFIWFRIRIHHFRLNTDPHQVPGFWWPKIEKNLQLQKKSDNFFSVVAIYPQASLKDVQATVQEKPSALKCEHSALQNMKFLNFALLCGHFSPPRSGIRTWSSDLIESGSGSETLIVGIGKQIQQKNIAVLRIRIRDPVPFCTLDPGSGIGFFRIRDPGSRIPNTYFESIVKMFWVKSSIILLKIGSNFFLKYFKNLIIFYFVEFVATKKVDTKFLSPLSFVAVFGSEIRDLGSGMGKNQDPG
jgi:hypothetical protein